MCCIRIDSVFCGDICVFVCGVGACLVWSLEGLRRWVDFMISTYQVKLANLHSISHTYYTLNR